MGEKRFLWKSRVRRKMRACLFQKASGEVYENRRHRWIAAKLKSMEPGQKILDAGAGERRYQRYCRHLKYVSQDFGEYDGAGDGHGLQTESWNTQGIDVRCDITDMPFQDGEFDIVMCTEVLEHVKDPQAAVKELVRVLRPGGVNCC